MTELIYSTNDEDYKYREFGEAVTNILDDESIKVAEILTIYEGELLKIKAGDYFNINNIDLISVLSESAFEECGEEAIDDWPECSDKQINALEIKIKRAINEWADQCKLQPIFGRVKFIKEIKIRLTSENGSYEVV